MSNTNTGGPAFPQCSYNMKGGYDITSGMTLRDYAAIHLKVPSSGTDWLDEMIRESLRNDIATKAMQGLLSSLPHDHTFDAKAFAEAAYEMADAMLKARQA